ncbi:glycosyl transferase group 1 [Clostridium sp. NSJ-6]|uniref:Glycosyl transferase group 1 n=1 Tax=Clostridium hominis TaxID=2763036 RepID=A0ABR7D9S4_9CLOT|nr:glycosyltransferase [Clostridium hominis]MBC5627473.1 glycosyl transferase group 1 [Clostridium hominis]MDU2672531.1 glycosyltransferase [Clostridium sp.]
MKILFIACYSPLINNSASIETLQYLNNLAKDNEVDLLTVNFPENSIYYDEYILKMLDEKVKLHIISGGKIFEKIMPKKSLKKIEDENAKKDSNFIKNTIKRAKNIVAIPDMYLNWARKASKYGIELVKKNNYDAIFSMHEPPSSHICALKIKEKFKDIQWVTYWSDPWLKDSTREGIGSIRKSIEGSWEKKVVELSDRFIFVTKANRDDYVKTYNIPIEKTYILTRGYDSNSYRDIKALGIPEKIDNFKVNFVYAGEIFSKLRDVNPFIEAVNEIKEKDMELFNSINILFFGNIDNKSVESKLKSVENVNVSPRIPYKEALSYMLNSEVLLLFGNKNSKQIPAKIYDYFGAEGRIFVILGDENDPIKDVVLNNDKCIVVNNNKDEIIEGINKIIGLVKENKLTKPLKEYEWANISERLNKILRG